MASSKNKGYRAVLWVLLGLLIVGLGGWFTGGAGGRRADSLGTVGGLELSAQGYANALRAQLRSFEEQMGAPLPFEQAAAIGLDRAALGQLVSQRVLDAETARLGLSAGDARVAAAVRGAPSFQGIDGSFDRDLYREQLRRNGLTEREFETAIREDSARALLQTALVGGVPEPALFAETLAAHAGERRTVTWAELSAEAVADTLPVPTEDELRAFHEANPDLFTAPEVRRIAYAWVTPAMLAEGAAVEDEAVRALYEERIADFVREERRLVERLVYPSAEEAQAARARLDAGEATFEQLTEERGLRLSDIDLGDVARGDLGGSADAIFAAQAGDVVGPVETTLGPALFRVNAVLAAEETPFEEAAPELRDELAFQAAARMIDEEVPRIEDLLAGGATLEDLAGQTSLETGTLDWTVEAESGIAAYAPFRDAAAAIEAGAFPSIVELGDGGVAVLRLDGVTPPALRPFDEARADVEAAWRSERLAAAALEQAQARAEAIAAGASFEEQDLQPVTEPPLTRRDFVAGTTPDFVAAAFEMQPGEARALPVGEAALVLRLDAVEPAAEDDPALVAQQEALAEQIRASTAQDVLDAFLRQLQADTEIRIDEAAVAAVNAQFQ